MNELQTLWARIKDRRRGMWAGMTARENAAGILFGPGPLEPAAALAYARSFDTPEQPSRYWREVAEAIEGATAQG